MTIISEPEPTEVMPTMMPPSIPIAIVGKRPRNDLVDQRAATLAALPIDQIAQRPSPPRRVSNAAPSATCTCFCAEWLLPIRCSR